MCIFFKASLKRLSLCILYSIVKMSNYRWKVITLRQEHHRFYVQAEAPWLFTHFQFQNIWCFYYRCYFLSFGVLSALSSSCQKQHFRLFFLPQNLRKALLMPPETDRQDVGGSTKKHKPAFNPSQYIQTNIVSSLPKIKIQYNLS